MMALSPFIKEKKTCFSTILKQFILPKELILHIKEVDLFIRYGRLTVRFLHVSSRLIIIIIMASGIPGLMLCMKETPLISGISIQDRGLFVLQILFQLKTDLYIPDLEPLHEHVVFKKTGGREGCNE